MRNGHSTINWDIGKVRAQFPALAIKDNDTPRIYADAPAGTQVPVMVLDRMRVAMVEKCANDGGVFSTSQAAEEMSHEAHKSAAAFLGVSADEIVFGLNTTTLLFSFARMISREWKEGDEIVVTRMDHDANVAPWLGAAEERGVTVRWLDFDSGTFEYKYEQLPDLINKRTRLVACNHASNILGSINDVARIIAAAREVGAVSVVDAVQSAPHIPLDARQAGCDIMVCSAYKFFGPHAALLYLAPGLRDRLKPFKVRPSSMAMPWRFAPGTPSFEAQAGTAAAIEYIASLAEKPDMNQKPPLRERIIAGLEAATAYERQLMDIFLSRTKDIKGFRLFGFGGNRLDSRVPTFSFRLEGHDPASIAKRLAAHGIFSWSGNFYAMEAGHKLGFDGDGGVNRVGFSHYSTFEEVERLTEALNQYVAG